MGIGANLDVLTKKSIVEQYILPKFTLLIYLLVYDNITTNTNMNTWLTILNKVDFMFYMSIFV